MKKLKPWLVILLVFVAGFVSGVVVTRIAVRHFVQRMVANPDRVRDLIERRLTARLRLDPAQQEKVHRILSETQDNLRDLRSDFAPRFQLILSNAESKISVILTPEQRERFEKLKEANRPFLERRRRQD